MIFLEIDMAHISRETAARALDGPQISRDVLRASIPVRAA